jgi:hypothetical protein
METAVKSNSGLLEGTRPYLEKAREAFPILVRQAKAGHPITYENLAKEIGMPNPRNLNYPLGSIGNAMQVIGKLWGEEIPAIQCLVLSKTTGLPGEGVYWFISNKEAYLNSTRQVRKQIVDGILADIYVYPKWNEVLAFLALKPIEIDFSTELESAKRSGGYGGGESESHKDFKTWVFNNPSALNLHGKITPIQMEYPFITLDEIDVAFRKKDTFIGVEVKSKISNKADILRGLFQCIKYDALIQAEQLLNPKTLSSQVILALEGSFPKSLIPVKNILGVEVVDNLR